MQIIQYLDLKKINFIDEEIIDEDSENDSYEEISIKEELGL